MRRLAIAAVLLLTAGACTNERAESLRAEIEKAKKERVETAAVERAKQESAAAEAAVAASRAALEQLRADAGKLEADRDQARAALAAEMARNERLRAAIEEVGRQAQERASRGQELDAKIAKAKARATWARDQAALLAREIRAGDPPWATARRIASLGEFEQRIAAEYPDDPVLAELARARILAESPTPDQARAAAEQAARLRDRLAAVYELAAPDVAASAPPSERKP